MYDKINTMTKTKSKSVIIDGEVHNNFINNEYDFKRTELLNKLGYKIIRFTNEDIYKSLELVLEAIKQEFKK